jgi:hypothetical protein
MNASVLVLAWFMSLGAPGPVVVGGPAEFVSAPPVRIRLTISAHEELRRIMRNLLTSELESRGPVQWVEVDADWTIGIVTTQLEDAEGMTAAIGVSFIIEQHGIHMRMMRVLAQACRYFIATGLLRDAPLEKDMRLVLRGVDMLPNPESLSVVSQHKMCVIPADRLPAACRDIAAAFDTVRLATLKAEPALTVVTTGQGR